MILLRKQPDTLIYTPQPTTTAWVRTCVKGADGYQLNVMEDAPVFDMNTGWRNRGPVQPTGCVQAKLSLLESGAVLASFPLLGALPGAIQPDPYTVWFALDVPALVPAGIFGREIEIPAGRHLMSFSPGAWLVFFRPNPFHQRLLKHQIP